jgi:hypothetical protein
MSGSARSGGTGLGCAGSGVMGSIGRREVGRLDMRGSVGRLDHWVQVVDLRSITLGENPLCAPAIYIYERDSLSHIYIYERENPLCAPESYGNTQFAPRNVDIASMPCSKFSHPSCLYRHLSLRIAPLKL